VPTLDPNIYGGDPTGAANAVSADALDVQTPGAAIADYWGDVQDTVRAQSEANVGREPTGTQDSTETPTRSRSVDLEKLPAYRTGKTTTGHDSGQKQPARHQKQPGERGSPGYSGLTDGKDRKS
jgi:hypothetical protein